MRSEQEEARRVCRICPELADCRAWTLAQPAYRMDASMVAAMTPAERFAECRKRRQKPWLAKLEPVRPGPVARHPARPGIPARSRRRLPAAEQMDTATVEFEEFLSRSVCQLVTSVGWPPRPTLGLTQRPGQRQSRPPARHRKPCGPRPAKSIADS
jgi:hypothetical protein